MIEHSGSRTADEVQAVLAEMREGREAARRLGCTVVERGPDGEWRAAIPWRGSHAATKTADRRRPLPLAARQLPTSTGLDADRVRRLRMAEATITPLALGRHPFWLGCGVSR